MMTLTNKCGVASLLNMLDICDNLDDDEIWYLLLLWTFLIFIDDNSMVTILIIMINKFISCRFFYSLHLCLDVQSDGLLTWHNIWIRLMIPGWRKLLIPLARRFGKKFVNIGRGMKWGANCKTLQIYVIAFPIYI